MDSQPFVSFLFFLLVFIETQDPTKFVNFTEKNVNSAQKTSLDLVGLSKNFLSVHLAQKISANARLLRLILLERLPLLFGNFTESVLLKYR